jgi:hypothetical protein
MKWMKFPSGRFKNIIKISDNKDENIFTLTYWQEDYFQERDRRFR